MIDPPAISNLSSITFGILDGLRLYRFLNIPQMEKLGIGKQKGRISHVLPELMRSNKPYIDRIVPGTLPKLGRLPNVYYLTEHGAATIADALSLDRDKVKFPKRVTTTSVHYWHRTHAVDCHISVQKWADINNNRVDLYLDYFEHTGSNRSQNKAQQRSVARVDFSGGSIIPDAIFKLSDDAGKPRFFALEMYNQNRPQRTIEKMLEYCPVLTEGALTKPFDYSHLPRILMVFNLEAALVIHLARAKQNSIIMEFSRFFFLTSLERFEKDFRTGWRTLDGEKLVNLF